MLEKEFILAGEGKHCWEAIDRECNADLYILFPHDGDSYNYYALMHMDRFIESKKSDKTVLLFSDSVIEKAVPLFVKSKVECRYLNSHEIGAVLKYYALYEFTSRLTIISLTRPYDTCGENLIGVKGVTKEDLLCFDIYRFSETPKADRPEYGGKDEEILEFLKSGCDFK